MTDNPIIHHPPNWFHSRAGKMSILAGILFAICAVLGLILTAWAAHNGEDRALQRAQDSAEALKCVQDAGTAFNEAVAAGVQILIDLNSANGDLSNANIELNSKVVEALIAVGQKDPEGLDAALANAGRVLDKLPSFQAETHRLESQADEIKLLLVDALDDRATALRKC